MAQLTTDASSGVILAFVTDQSIRAHRIDNQPLTENDWQHVFTSFGLSLRHPNLCPCLYHNPSRLPKAGTSPTKSKRWKRGVTRCCIE